MCSIYCTSVLLSLLSCAELGVKTASSIDTAFVDYDSLPDFVVTEIDPRYGTPSGGTSVVISGNGFEGNVHVSFGNVEIDITVIDAQTILFQTPFSPTEGSVDVTVVSDIGTDTIENGFTYTNAAPDNENTTDTTDTPTVESTGLTGGLVEIWRRLYACPDCFNPPYPQQTLEASASIHDPTQGSWVSWFPPMNTCLSVLTYPDLGSTINLGSVALTGPVGNINLILDNASGMYLNSNVSTSLYKYNSIYGLQSSALNFQSLLQTPSTLDAIEPSGMLDPTGFVQPFSKNNFAIFWGPSGTTDSILFLLEVYGTDGSYDTVTCLTSDSGGLGLDPPLLSSFSSDDLLVISLYRVQLTGAIHPDNGSTIEAVSAVGVIGTGYLVE